MKKSAGILCYKHTDSELLVLLGHPGGPFWKNKEIGAWSIPKGEFDDDEEPLSAAIREFREETGITLEGNFVALEPVKLKSGKIVFAWAIAADVDVSSITSNTCPVEWPPRSGKFIDVPELDRAEWLTIADAMEKINPGQAALISQLVEILK